MTIKFYEKNAEGLYIQAQIEPFVFPGGEHHFKVEKEIENDTVAVMTGADANDLILLTLWADMTGNLKKTLILPYAPAARADRGTPFGARVYASLINNLELNEVIIFDPHSPTIVELLNNVRVVHSAEFMKNFIAGETNTGGNVGFVGVIAPDEGAVDRATEAAEVLEVPLFRAVKTRDFETGKLLDYKIVDKLPTEGKLLVVDDICDGGGTFALLAQASNLPPERLALWVSHGIFSGRAGENLKTYGSVYTTDSHPGCHNEDVKAFIAPLLSNLLASVD